MPNILVKIPHGAFPDAYRSTLVRKLNDAAATAEQIPDEPGKRMLCWVVIDEQPAGAWTCGAIDMSARLLPCLVVVHVPAGVLDGAARAVFVALIHQAFKQALPNGEQRQLATSVIINEVVEGNWGANGKIVRLPELTQVAGYMHLQSLLAGAA